MCNLLEIAEEEHRIAGENAIEKGVKEAVGTLIVDFESYGKAPLVEQVTLDEMAERYKKAGI